MGEWGTGKTSVLKLIEEAIGESAVSLRFNPWLFSSAEELVSRFFTEVAAQLEGYQDEEIRSLAARVAAYGKALAPLAQVLVPGLGTAMSAGVDALSGAVDDPRVSTRDRYESLATALVEIPRPLVVYIDDVDRLGDDEIREVMRLVKLVGDLPNVVYVLAYDRARVEEALGPDAKRGRAYIEKIVQVPRSLPPIRTSQLQKLALDELAAALGDDPFPFFDERRWGELFRQGIAPMMTTLRDARRYANVALLSADLVKDEVTGEDVLALEALHVFEPDVHAALPRLARLLTGTSRQLGDQAAADEERRAVIEGVLADARDAEAVRSLLRELFPGGGHLLGGSHYEPDLRVWRQARRVASSDVLDVYLHASFSEDGIATKRVLEIVGALSDEARLRRMVDDVPDEALNGLLDRMEDYREEFGPQDVPAMGVFLDLFPRLHIGPNFSLFPSEWALEGVIRSLLGAATIDERPRLVRVLFDSAPSLTARWYVLIWFTVSEESRRAGDETRVVSQATAQELQRHLRHLVIDAEPASLLSESSC